jgi:hypothetical protein
MGNCFTSSAGPSSTARDFEVAGRKQTISVASTVSEVCCSETFSISPDFVITDSTTVPEGALSSSILRVIRHGPQSSFVVLSPETGLVLASVSRVNPKLFLVSTPDGRSVGQVHVSKPALGRKTVFDMVFTSHSPSIRAVRAEDNVLRISRGESICQVVDDRFVGSVLRGTDIVIVCIISTVSALESSN